MRLHGKTLAVGGYAVLAPTGCGLALPVKSTAMDVAVSVRPGRCGSITLVIPRPRSTSIAEIPATKTDFYSAPDPETAFVRVACLVLLAYLRTAHNGLEITIKTSYSESPGAKLGIGSSAMVTVGTVVELANSLDTRLGETEIFVLAHFSCLLVQGQSSGYDIASVLNQTPIVYRQNGHYHSRVHGLAHAARSGTRLSDLTSHLRAIANGDVLPTILPVSIPRFHFYLFKFIQQLGKETSTARELRRLSPIYATTQSYSQLLKASETLTNILIAHESSIECIKEQIQEYRQAQRLFSAENGVEIEPKEISNLIESLTASDGVVGAMCVGAGGYDAFLCITTSVAVKDTFKGYLVVDINL